MTQPVHARLSVAAHLALALLALGGFVSFASPAFSEQLGTSQQPLVSQNPPVDTFTRERLGLITLSARPPGSSWTCSGALLTNLWILTAAHCVENNGVQIGPDALTFDANFSDVGHAKGVRIIRYRPHDVAIIRVDAPIRVLGSERRVQTQLWQPSDGKLKGMEVRLYGRGYNSFAVNTPQGPVPGQFDGLYRWMDATISSEDVGNTFTVPASQQQSPMPGDSGGPAYLGYAIVGVVSGGKRACIAGKTDSSGVCPGQWVTAKTSETYAAVSAVAAEIAADIAGDPPPQWGDMSIVRHQLATDYIKPTIKMELDNYRVDNCSTFASDCGRPAASAFCSAHQTGFIGKVDFETEPFGHTAIGATGKTCFGACIAFKHITCFTGRPNVFTSKVTDSSVLLGGTTNARVTEKTDGGYVPRVPAPVVGETGGVAGPAPTITGTFDTDFGVLTLTARDGSYTVNNGHVTIEHIYGDFMDGTWSQSTSAQQCSDGTYRGRFHFKFTNDGFAGSYGYCDGPINAGRWNGTRRR